MTFKRRQLEIFRGLQEELIESIETKIEAAEEDENLTAKTFWESKLPEAREGLQSINQQIANEIANNPHPEIKLEPWKMGQPIERKAQYLILTQEGSFFASNLKLEPVTHLKNKTERVVYNRGHCQDEIEKGDLVWKIVVVESGKE